jgi:hypothetical protein
MKRAGRIAASGRRGNSNVSANNHDSWPQVYAEKMVRVLGDHRRGRSTARPWYSPHSTQWTGNTPSPREPRLDWSACRRGPSSKSPFPHETLHERLTLLTALLGLCSATLPAAEVTVAAPASPLLRFAQGTPEAALDSKRYFSVADFVKAGGVAEAGKLSPVASAMRLDSDGAEALERLASVPAWARASRGVECGLTDIEIAREWKPGGARRGGESGFEGMAKASPRLRVSDDHRFLVTGKDQPFFRLGDTAWELSHRLNREEAERYLSDRAKREFTVIQAVALAELDGLTEPSRAGFVPLVNGDPARPDLRPGPGNDFWDFVDEVLDLAAARRLYVGLLPTWGKYVTSAPFDGKVDGIFNATNALAYGQFLGRRPRSLESHLDSRR